MDQIKIGKFIADLRKKKKMTQEKLSEKLGVTNRSVSRWENGKCMPDLALLPLLSRELDVTINELLSGEKINNDDYQKAFEENMVNIITKDRKDRRFIFITNFLFVVMIFIILCCCYYLFFYHVYFSRDYEVDNMKVEEIDYPGFYEGDLSFSTNYEGKLEYLFKTYSSENKNCNVVFVTYKSNIKKFNDVNIKVGSGMYFHKRIPTSYFENEERFKIYYTDVSFNKIKNTDDYELKEIINNSVLLYESK